MLLQRLTLRCLVSGYHGHLCKYSGANVIISGRHQRRWITEDSPTPPSTGCRSKTVPVDDVTQLNTAVRESVKNILRREPSEQLIQVYGWIRVVQKQKKTSFVHLDEGSGSRLQLVIPNELLERKPANGSAISATGRLVKSAGRQQSVELLCESFQVLGDCDPKTYQIGHLAKDLQLDFLRERVHLRPRVRYFQSMLRLRSELQNAVQIFMKQAEFTHVTTPMVTANDCEGGGECFTLKPTNWKDSSKDYFGRPTYLTVSGQLHLEALASSLSRVYTLGPVFRAEKSMSPKHLSEFLMLEAEEAFIFSLDTLLNRVEALCKFLAFYLERHCADDLAHLRSANDNYQSAEKISTGRYARVTYQEAVEVLAWMDQFKEDFKNQETEPVNLNAQMERALVQLLDNRPVFVTHYPSKVKPFYMKTAEDKALCFDLLMPICGEVAGGSLREDNLEQLQANISARMTTSGQQSPPPNLEWYLDLRRYGHAPLGGFGLGFDRFLQTLTGTANIKDVVPFPRWPYHCYL